MSRARSLFPVLAVAMAALLHPCPASAQDGEAPVLAPGSRVRITAPSLGLDRSVAVLRETRSGAFLVELPDQEGLRRVEYSGLEALDVSTGRKSRKRRGAMIGTLVGVAAGGIWALGAEDDPPCPASHPVEAFASALFCEPFRLSAGDKAAARLLGGAGLGALTGLIIGHFVKSDVWTPVESGDAGVSLRPVVSSQGAGLALRLGAGT